MKKILQSVGPAIVVAAVVLGPGSITTSTKVGATFGYDVLWVLLVILILLIGLASLAAWLGATMTQSLCGELNTRLGKWAGGIIGIAAFVIVAGFQSSNNMAVVAGLEPMFGREFSTAGIIATLAVTNGIIIAILYLAKDLYQYIEKLMKIFVGLMIIAFIVNFFWAKPSIPDAAAGLIPDFRPFGDKLQLLTLMGLIGTTFSVVGAFYQGYLVREKGWTVNDLGAGRRDSIIGMCVLVGVTAIIMMTSAAVFAGKTDAAELGNAGAISAQLEPLFGAKAKYIFCFGFLAGAFSSFLVNAMIGGHVFSDGMGRGGKLQSKFSQHSTTAALLVGMVIGILALTTDFDRTTTIVIAQAATVIGGPAVVAALLYLGLQQRKAAEHKTPMWMLVIAGVSLIVSLSVATRTVLKLTGVL
ncbi:MAG: Nramp family divalent metal transporter [Verrucomicrobiales bacterium]|nr:Nramp family divalent metal transporter [Verrucomicrobiales bacterium]